MRLVDYLDKGASLDPGAPCLVCEGETATYAEVRALSERIAAALVAVVATAVAADPRSAPPLALGAGAAVPVTLLVLLGTYWWS